MLNCFYFCDMLSILFIENILYKTVIKVPFSKIPHISFNNMYMHLNYFFNNINSIFFKLMIKFTKKG